MDSETLQEMIHINLVLLYNNGHNIDFEEGMFKERNLPGFEKVAYALALVISGEEAKKSIPWPLLNDKKLRSDFRLKFCKFIKATNTKYNANIPELSASNLQYPGGQMFLTFMYRLSTFTMELELKRTLSPEGKKELLERYDTSKLCDSDVEVCTNICLGNRYREEEKMLEHVNYQAEASSAIKELEVNKFLEDLVKSSQAKLQSSVTDLDVDEHTKERLLDINCTEVMEDWNRRTEVKIGELKRANERLCRIGELTTSVTQQMMRKSADNRKERICLDGSRLNVTQSIAKFTNAPVRNNRGDIKLKTIFEAGLAAARRLPSSSPSQPSQLPWARDLYAEAKAQSERARKCSAALHRLETACEEEIAEIRPILYESVIDKARPEWFMYLRSVPLVPLVVPLTMNNSTVNKEKKRRLSSVVKLERQKKKKKTMNVHTSFKLKRPFLHPLMTPSLHSGGPRACSTALRASPLSCAPRAPSSVKKSRPSLSTVSRPSCKKSLYGKLPSGARQIEDDVSQDLSDDPEFPPLSTITEDFVVKVDEPAKINHCKSVMKPAQEKQKRRSLDLVIERYKQLKAKKNETLCGSQN